MTAIPSARPTPRTCAVTQEAPEGEPYAAITETHTSVLIFVGGLAYKAKKPVTLPFIDLGTPEARLENSLRELELNRVITPDVYLGLSELRPLYLPGAIGEPVLVMRRMPTARRLSAVLGRGEDASRWLADVAEQVTRLHRREPPLQGFALAQTMQALWREGREQLGPFAGTVLPREELDAVAVLAQEYLAGRAPLLDDRERAGLVRAGHGDLLSEDVFCLEDGARILDCLEFDERLRGGDTAMDAAFLAMDLEAHGHPDAARTFLDRYEELAHDDAPLSLTHHYIAYRAFVRAKVEALRSAQGSPGAAGAARDLLALCREHLEQARVHLVLLGGLPGSGKSTIASALGRDDPWGRQWVTLSSDVVRKELAGHAPLTSCAAPYGQGIYDSAGTRVTYEELLRRAARSLVQGINVIVDASWNDAGFRAHARRIAEQAHGALTEARCEAPLDLCAQRVGGRRGVASDADEGILAAMAADADPWPEAHAVPTTTAPHVDVRTLLRLLAPREQTDAGHMTEGMP